MPVLQLLQPDGTVLYEVRVDPNPRFVIGRSQYVDMVIHDGSIARRHAVLSQHPDGSYWIADNGSTNGIYVNGERVEEPVYLEGSEELRLGNARLRYLQEPSRSVPEISDAKLERLLLQIREEPREAHHYLVCADWMQQLGDPRGRLIALQHQEPGAGEALIHEYRAHFLGPLVGSPQLRGVGWRLGFWDALSLAGGREEISELLSKGFEHPSAMVLRALELSTDELGCMLAFSAIHLHQVPIEELRLGTSAGVELSAPRRWSPFQKGFCPRLGDLTRLLPGAPKLRSLAILSDDFSLAPHNIENLERLELGAGRMLQPRILSMLARAPLPKLHTLLLDFGAAYQLGRDPNDRLQRLWSELSAPALTRLTMIRSPLRWDQALGALSRAPFVAQLERLAIYSEHPMRSAGAGALEKLCASLPRLEQLELSAPSVEMHAQKLRALAPEVKLTKVEASH